MLPHWWSQVVACLLAQLSAYNGLTAETDDLLGFTDGGLGGDVFPMLGGRAGRGWVMSSLYLVISGEGRCSFHIVVFRGSVVGSHGGGFLPVPGEPWQMWWWLLLASCLPQASDLGQNSVACMAWVHCGVLSASLPFPDPGGVSGVASVVLCLSTMLVILSCGKVIPFERAIWCVSTFRCPSTFTGGTQVPWRSLSHALSFDRTYDMGGVAVLFAWMCVPPSCPIGSSWWSLFLCLDGFCSSSNYL